MAGIFGTDGVRAQINTGAMRAEFVVRLALAAGRYFMQHREADTTTIKHRPQVVIGKDTRLSGYMLEAALVAGFTSIGMDCRLTGPVPTAAVAHLTHSIRADLGVMISASHNPHHDNGIKLFGPDGQKLDDEVEAEISALAQGSIALAAPEDIGRARRMLTSAARYQEFAKSTFPRGLELDGLKIVVDCAHGAAYRTAPETLFELGAEVISMGVAPDGLNINQDVGATAPQALAERVLAEQADIGIALDGDADRLMLVDETGRVRDGDFVLAALATSMSAEGRLRGPVVGTLMSNLGLQLYLETQDIGFERARVGDRYILEKLRSHDANLGGEPSGHILLPDATRSGDGLIAALQVLALLVGREKSASEVLGLFEAVPQKLTNLKDIDKALLDTDKITALIADIEADFAGTGRVLLRPSGTEPLVRVMVEAEDEGKLDAAMEQLCAALRAG